MKEKTNKTLETSINVSTQHGDDMSHNAYWGYTQKAEDVAEERKKRERMAGRKERHTIGRDTPISGGVYEGAYGGEAIVVDSEKYREGLDEALKRIYGETYLGDVDGKPRFDKGKILESVFTTVTDMIRYDADAVEGIFQREAKGRNGTKISLDYYVNEGVGVCRHQALFVAQILEELANEKIIRGHVSVDRNVMRQGNGPDGDNYDGHAWTRYTNSTGEVFILDVAQGVIAPLDSVMNQHDKGLRTWDYARPEDYKKRQRRTGIDSSGIIQGVPYFSDSEEYVSSANVKNSNRESRQNQEKTEEEKRLERLFTLPKETEVDKYGQSKRERAVVTTQSEQDAATVFRYAKNNTIDGLFNEYKRDLWQEKDMPRVLRENPELRVKLGGYLLEKIRTLDHVPDRFSQLERTLKSPAHPGYADLQLTSEEYSAMLALSMLDGTFKWEKTRHDPIIVNQYGEGELGQHRLVALMALGIANKGLFPVKRRSV